MIARSFSSIALAVACAALIASPQMARAGRPQPVSETKSLHVTSALGYMELESDYPGCAVWFAYKQTGVVNLEAVLSGGMVSGAIGVSVEGRAPGVYTVSAVTASSSNTVVLGTLRVRVSGTSSAGAKSTAGYARFGSAGLPLPEGLSPFDIASVSICAGETTANLNPDPAGVDSFSWGGEQSYCLLNDTPIPYSHYNVLCPLTAGTNAPGASGFALIRATWGSLPLSGAALDFPVAGHLTIHAQGLPASTTLTYAADGTDLGSATTDAAGKLNVFASQGQNGTLPSSLDIYSVKTVTVHDALGNVLVSAGL